MAKKILLVDDTESVRLVMKDKLISWGYDVIAASSGEEAVNMVKDGKEHFDALILDIMMPGIDGIEALRRIRKFNKKIPAIMLTAYPSSKKISDSESLGIAGFIPKETEFESASGIIRVALKGAV